MTNHKETYQLAAIDVETGGFDPRKDALLEVGIRALNEDLTYNIDIAPFHVRIHKGSLNVSPKALEVNGLDPNEGIHRLEAADLFHAWMSNHGIEKLVPVGQNYPFDKGFLEEWIGGKTYRNNFHYHFEDTMATARGINRAAVCGYGKPLFPGTRLEDLAKFFKIDYTKGHTALGDCDITVQVYKQLVEIQGMGVLNYCMGREEFRKDLLTS